MKQGSVLSPTIFLIVINQLVKQLRDKKHGLSVCNTYVGVAIHADDLRTTAPSKEVMDIQAKIITRLATGNDLKLNESKLEVVKVSRQNKDPENLTIAGAEIQTTPAVKCIGVWWLLATISVRLGKPSLPLAIWWLSREVLFLSPVATSMKLVLYLSSFMVVKPGFSTLPQSNLERNFSVKLAIEFFV